MSFADRSASLTRPLRTRRQVLASALALAAAPVASGASVPPPGLGVPSDLSAAAAAYGKALDASVRLGDTESDPRKLDDASERAGRAELRLLTVMRSHGIGACVVAGRLFIDRAALAADPDGGVGLDVGILDVADVRGI